MATLDDKLLGEKLHYYCSSSEDEDETPVADSSTAPPPPPSIESGTTSNTGPKGVLKDYQRYKQLETEKRAEAGVEKLALAKKLNLHCKSEREEREEKEREQQIEAELQELMVDDFMQEYMQKRMQEMMTQSSNSRKKFGRLLELRTGEEFLDAVDQEDKRCTVMVLIHQPDVPGCHSMLGCLGCLAKDYPTVKFCHILGSAAGLSKHFKVSGVPALLVYREGQLLANFIRLTDQLGEDFYANEVESFLLEHSLLPNKEEDMPRNIRSSTANQQDSDTE